MQDPHQWTPEHEERFYVEAIRDYRLLLVNNVRGDVGYDPSLGNRRWEVRYLVKWWGYSEENNTYEPMAAFDQWTAEHAQEVRVIEQLRGRDSVEALTRDAHRLNNAL